MTNPMDVLNERFSAALGVAFGPEYADVDPVIRPSDRAKFDADYQANAALALAKRIGSNPREVATGIVAALEADDLISEPTISGPGFINLSLRADWISEDLAGLGKRLGVPRPDPRTVVIDYSAPNVAKEMHVGHLRTTVVGDALVRTLEHLGHRVIRQNHVGDWGTPFGMLLEHLLDVGEHSEEAALLASSPNDFYQAARAKFDGDPVFADRARARVVTLQAQDGETLRIWQDLMGLSKVYFNSIYALLGVTLGDEDLAGESTYNAELAGVCAELEDAGIAVVSNGALCMFHEEFTGREGKPVPLIIRKSDGGYNYGTTDLATIRHRVRDLGGDRLLYVVGDPQSLHLQMVFATARKAGWLPPDVEVVHVRIGNVLGPDKKILRTRSGQTPTLRALLDEAVEKAGAVLDESRPGLSGDERSVLAHEIGIGAVKYADLSVSHDSEYVFDLDRMVALTGNTGPYLQYAAARIRSILRRATSPSGSIVLGEPAERELALTLLGFGAVVESVGETLEPHRLCGYLFELAQRFTTFYEACPVLTSAEVASRLALCEVTLDVLVTGLELLGISAPERM